MYIYMLFDSPSLQLYSNAYSKQRQIHLDSTANKTTTRRSPKNLQRPQCGKTLVASGLR